MLTHPGSTIGLRLPANAPITLGQLARLGPPKGQWLVVLVNNSTKYLPKVGTSDTLHT